MAKECDVVIKKEMDKMELRLQRKICLEENILLHFLAFI
jgi:hypothetical protein